MDHMADTIRERWGRRWHVNCHSMYSPAYAAGLDNPYMPSTDIILGDRDGATSAIEFTNLFAEFLIDEGLSVAINDQFKGVELVRRYGDPVRNCHSVQVEIDRGLYMDEWNITRKPGFSALHESLNRVVGKLADYVSSQL